MKETIGVVDIGSNTIKLVVYNIKNGIPVEIYTKSMYLRLLNYLINKDDDPSNERKIISKEGILKTKSVLMDFKKELEQYQPSETIAFATYVVRVADNRDEFVNEMKDYFDIRVLSEQEEAYYSAYGALLDKTLKLEKDLICDMGGGSLELCRVNNHKITDCKSYPLGTLYFKEFFDNGILSNEDLAIDMIKQHIKNNNNECFETLVGVGGSIRAISKIAGSKQIKFEKLAKIFHKIKQMSPSEISSKYKISEKRSETVVSAALAMLEIMKIYSCKNLIISKYGIREGIISKLLLEDKKL